MRQGFVKAAAVTPKIKVADTKYNAELIMIPCSISSTSERNNFQPAIAKGDRKQTIIDHMNEYSEKYSKIGFDANGRVIIREE